MSISRQIQIPQESIQSKFTPDNIEVRDSTVTSTVTLQSLIPLVQNMPPYFSHSSKNIRLSGASTLLADCQKSDGTWVPSSLDLDTGIGNTEGHFDRKSTNYSQSATNVQLSGTRLSADLARSGPPPMPDSINLDENISNVEGVLTFWG